MTRLQSSDGEFPASVSYSLPGFDGKSADAFGFAPDVDNHEMTEGGSFIESEPFITFEPPDDGKAEMASPVATLYSLSTCSHCKAVRDLLTRYDIKYEVVEIDRLEGDRRKKTLAEVKQYNERVSFPTTVIGDTVIVGYQADLIKKALQR